MTFLTMWQKTWHCVTIPVCDFDFEELYWPSLFSKECQQLSCLCFKCVDGEHQLCLKVMCTLYGAALCGVETGKSKC